MDYMKARYPMKCEHCKANIATGSQFVMFRGRPWIAAHVVEYRARRRATFKSGD